MIDLCQQAVGSKDSSATGPLFGIYQMDGTLAAVTTGEILREEIVQDAEAHAIASGTGRKAIMFELTFSAWRKRGIALMVIPFSIGPAFAKSHQF